MTDAAKVEHQMRGKSHVYIQSGEKMNKALKIGQYNTVITQSPEILATDALYDNRTEFEREDINLSH
jgi:hypothetical protein